MTGNKLGGVPYSFNVSQDGFLNQESWGPIFPHFMSEKNEVIVIVYGEYMAYGIKNCSFDAVF